MIAPEIKLRISPLIFKNAKMSANEMRLRIEDDAIKALSLLLDEFRMLSPDQVNIDFSPIKADNEIKEYIMIATVKPEYLNTKN